MTVVKQGRTPTTWRVALQQGTRVERVTVQAADEADAVLAAIQQTGLHAAVRIMAVRAGKEDRG